MSILGFNTRLSRGLGRSNIAGVVFCETRFAVTFVNDLSAVVRKV